MRPHSENKGWPQLECRCQWLGKQVRKGRMLKDRIRANIPAKYPASARWTATDFDRILPLSFAVGPWASTSIFEYLLKSMTNPLSPMVDQVLWPPDLVTNGTDD